MEVYHVDEEYGELHAAGDGRRALSPAVFLFGAIVMAGDDYPKNRINETMTAYRCAKWRFRVWREEPKFKMGPDNAVIAAIQTALDLYYDEPEKIVKHITDHLDRINDVEITNNEGDGACVYPDWP